MLSRSNEGCHRTSIRCPRCKQPWSEGTLDGNPDYFYNFMMMVSMMISFTNRLKNKFLYRGGRICLPSLIGL